MSDLVNEVQDRLDAQRAALLEAGRNRDRELFVGCVFSGGLNLLLVLGACCRRRRLSHAWRGAVRRGGNRRAGGGVLA